MYHVLQETILREIQYDLDFIEQLKLQLNITAAIKLKHKNNLLNSILESTLESTILDIHVLTTVQFFLKRPLTRPYKKGLNGRVWSSYTNKTVPKFYFWDKKSLYVHPIETLCMPVGAAPEQATKMAQLSQISCHLTGMFSKPLKH